MCKKNGRGYFARRNKFGRKRRKYFLNKKKFSKKSRATSAEGIVASAFAELINESFFDAFTRAKHNDSLDASHIDIVAINFSQPKLFALQVKTKVRKKIGKNYETPLERHKRKYPYIPVVEVNLGQDKRTAITNAKIKIKKLYKENPSAEEVLDKKTLNIIAERFVALGHEVFFK